MLIPDELKKYTEIPEDCPKYDKYNPDYRCSVDYSDYRKEKALAEADKESVSIYEICDKINSFLRVFKMESNCIIIEGLDILKTINYEQIKHLYKLNNQSDLVWMKFTTDGYLGVVASSNDINFDYDNTSSGKLIKSVNKKWDKNKIIIVPLPAITSRKERLLIEQMIGSFLTENNVPIIDYYSHFLGN